MPPLPTEEQFKRDIEVLSSHPPLQVAIPLPEAFAIMAQLQLALRHPANAGPTAAIARHFARILQRAIALTPTLQTLAEAGWNPAHDVTTGDEGFDHVQRN